MRTILLLIFLNVLSTGMANAEIPCFSDTTDLEHIISPRDPDFVHVLSRELLNSYLLSETEISCPSLVLVTYDEKGKKLSAASYPLSRFIESLEGDELFQSGRIYLIHTRFRTYYFNTLKGGG